MEEENYYRWDGNREDNSVISLYMPHYNVNKHLVDTICSNPKVSITIDKDNGATMVGSLCEFFNNTESKGDEQLAYAIAYAISMFAKQV